MRQLFGGCFGIALKLETSEEFAVSKLNEYKNDNRTFLLCKNWGM